MSCRGPRPQCSPLAVSSHSITPLAASVMVTYPSSPRGAERRGVERGEDAGLTVGGQLRDLTEPRLPQHPHRELAALVHAPVLGGDRWLPDPLLQTLDALVVPLRDLREHGGQVGFGFP